MNPDQYTEKSKPVFVHPSIRLLVPSVSLCKLLKELHYPQDKAMFYWRGNSLVHQPPYLNGLFIAAPTLEDLMDFEGNGFYVVAFNGNRQYEVLDLTNPTFNKQSGVWEYDKTPGSDSTTPIYAMARATCYRLKMQKALEECEVFDSE